MLILITTFSFSACGGSSTTDESNLSSAENAGAHVATNTPPSSGRGTAAWMNVSTDGSSSSFAVRQDGRLFAWGSSQRLQSLFGNAMAEGQDNELERRPFLQAVEVMDNVAYISSGSLHTMILDTNGALWGVGSNNHGQLGDGTIAQRPYPIRVMDNVIAVSAGQNHTMAITADGVLFAWGANLNGQLGDGTTTTRHSPVQIMEDVIAVSAGHHHTAAIASDGRLWAWGGAHFISIAADGSVVSPEVVPSVIMYDVVAVSVGDNHSMAITSDGGLWAWGINTSGQLGDGFATRQPEPVRVKDDVMMVSAGRGFTAAITAGGVLYTWGINTSGQLGDGTTATRHLPTRIMDDVVFIHASSAHTMAITVDGALWVWGDGARNAFGFWEAPLVPSVVDVYE